MARYTKEGLMVAIGRVSSMKELCAYLGLPFSGGNHRHLSSLLVKYGIPTSHWEKPVVVQRRGLPLSELFALAPKGNESRVKTSAIRKGFIELGLPMKCPCGLDSTWEGRPLVLQLDHINGNRCDNRLDNLRWLCPNCHTQTDNYAGRASRKIAARCTYCACGKVIQRGSKSCYGCMDHRVPHPAAQKANWPPNEELAQLLQNLPATKVAVELGVTSTALKKHCTRRGISTPPRGYWAKIAGAEVQAAKPILRCSGCQKPVTDQATTGKCITCYNKSKKK